MAGRAGRRGKDDQGTVILYLDNKLMRQGVTTNDMYEILENKGQPLESKFKLTYQMILYVLKNEEVKMEDLMKKSFFQS